MGTLYIVGTPIGNLEDITLRAIRVLQSVGFIMAEDTRSARTLLSHHGILTPVTSFHEFTKPGKLARLVERIEDGEEGALISEAGMPCISDPGYPLVREALVAGCQVTCVPGPSAVLAALVLSGLPTNAFHYVGFLPRRVTERRKLLEELSRQRDTLVCFEAPHRLLRTLRDIVLVCGDDRPMAVTRELTKRYEEVARGTAADMVTRFETQRARGEFTLVIAGARDGRVGGSSKESA